MGVERGRGEREGMRGEEREVRLEREDWDEGSPHAPTPGHTPTNRTPMAAETRTTARILPIARARGPLVTLRLGDDLVEDLGDDIVRVADLVLGALQCALGASVFWVASVFWAVASVSVYPTLRASAPRPGQGMEDIATKLLTFAASSSSSSAGISAVNSVSRSASVAVSVISSSASTSSFIVGVFSVAPLSRRASASALGLLLAVVAATLSDSETARTATSTSRAAWGRMVLFGVIGEPMK